MTNFDILDKNNASPSPDKQLKFNYSEICGTPPAKAAHCIFGGKKVLHVGLPCQNRLGILVQFPSYEVLPFIFSSPRLRT